MASTDLVFANESEAQEAINDLRNNNTATNYVLFTYSDSQKNTLNLTAKGTGGVEELKTHLDNSKASYGLVRVTDKIDESVTVKFVFIVWVGEKVPFLKKAQITTHKGSVTSLVGQYHNDVQASELGELTEDIIISKVTAASGSASHVRDASSSSSHSQSSSSASHSSSTTAPTTSYRATQSTTPKSVNTTKTPGVGAAATTSVIQFVNEDEIRTAIKQLRADNDPTDWILLSYEGNTTKVRLAGQGVSGIDELIGHLKEDQVCYGLYRTTDTIDNTVAVKFVLIIWVGEKVPFIRKAKITTHKGDITAFVGQYHVDLNCSNLHEISDEIVRDLVQRASGTAVHVK
jgi:ssRNA-specific RNase YbeY (16S rRNA maturation enzyme)